MQHAVIMNVWENNGWFHGLDCKMVDVKWRLIGEITLDDITPCHETYINSTLLILCAFKKLQSHPQKRTKPPGVMSSAITMSTMTQPQACKKKPRPGSFTAENRLHSKPKIH